MAEILKDYKFRSRIGQTYEKYPWTEWADGKTRRLKMGVDFHNSPTRVMAAGRAYAKGRGLIFYGEIDGNNVVVKFAKRQTNK